MARWGYVVSAVKNKLTGSKAAYGARIQHMDILRGNALYKEIAQYLAINPVLAENLVNGMGGFIQYKLQNGYKLDFGTFKVGLSLRGGFDSENAGFDPSRNKVCVTLSPGVQLAKSVAKLQPENITNTDSPAIKSVCTLDGSRPSSVISCHEPCGMNGSFPNTDLKGDGDGIWLETENGERITSAKITAITSTRVDFQIERDVTPGRYTLFFGAHSRNDVGIASDSINITIATNAHAPTSLRDESR